MKSFNFQNGETPLHKACRKCHYPAVKELLAHAKKQNKDNEQKIEQYVRQANHDGEQVRIKPESFWTRRNCLFDMLKNLLYFWNRKTMCFFLVFSPNWMFS